MKEKKINVTQRVTELVEPIVSQAGVHLWDVRFEKEGASWFLRVVIDSDEGITFDDCEAVTRPLNKLLDELDFIVQSYYLEVSSPGLMRQLRTAEHFLLCIGDKVVVRLIRPDEDGVREIYGVLLEYTDGNITLKAEQGDIVLAVSTCAFVKLDDDIDLSML